MNVSTTEAIYVTPPPADRCTCRRCPHCGKVEVPTPSTFPTYPYPVILAYTSGGTNQQPCVSAVSC